MFDRPIQTVGRRKEAVVRVRLVPGTGKFELNGRSLEDYFPNKVHQQLIKAAAGHRRTGGQLRHLRAPARRRPLGPGRCAAPGHRPGADLASPEDRPALKKAGFLTRDPRANERKKYGLKKARKAPQYSKR